MTNLDLSTYPAAQTASFGRWQALNAPLGITGFGVNAILCDPGEAFSIEHDERETGHQELYVVVAGRARFVIDGEETEAGPGEVVAITEASATRDYKALEPGTRIVCIGAPPLEGDTGFGQWIADSVEGEEVAGH